MFRLVRGGASPPIRNMSRPPAYLRQNLLRRLDPIMVIIPVNRFSESQRPTVRAPERNSAQSLRPTFSGWGPRI